MQKRWPWMACSRGRCWRVVHPSCHRPISIRVFPRSGPAEGDHERNRALDCARHTMYCIAHYGRANFAKSREHGLTAQAHFTQERWFGDVLVNVFLGMSAMAQGQVQEASERYRLARKVARRRLASDPCFAGSTDVLIFELDIERNRKREIRQRTLKRLTQLPRVWVEIHATAIAVAAELMLEQYGRKAALQLLSQAVEDVRRGAIESLSNNLSALFAYYLVEVGRSSEAARVWSDHGLPCGVADLVDLQRRSWRTMEALSCVACAVAPGAGGIRRGRGAGEQVVRYCVDAWPHAHAPAGTGVVDGRGAQGR